MEFALSTLCGTLVIMSLDVCRCDYFFRDDLKNFLRPFAQEGREVAEVDVRRFFEARAEVARIGQKR